MSHVGKTLPAVLIAVLWTCGPANAQPIGTFRWQLQPYCNVLTLNVTQQNGIYTLDGTDNQCAGPQAASAIGIAFLHPSGAVGFGISIVSPGGTPVHVEATINMSSLSGTWRDSAGQSGAFIFTPGAGTGGAARPVPSTGVAPASITAVHIAPGAVGATQIAAASVTGAQVADSSLTIADMADAPLIAFAAGPELVALSGTEPLVLTVTLTAPTAGRIIANASGYFRLGDPSDFDTARCSITREAVVETAHLILVEETELAAMGRVPFGGTRGFTVGAGPVTINLVCEEISGNVSVGSSNLTALFVAGS